MKGLLIAFIFPVLLVAQVTTHRSHSVLEIRGQNWTLSYRAAADTSFYISSPDRAFFSHGRSLRWIDTQRGVVLKRWLFGEWISGLQAPSVVRPDTVRVTLHAFKDATTFDFDGEHPDTHRMNVFPWDSVRFMQAALCEGAAFLSITGPACALALEKARPDVIRDALPRMEEMARRDGTSPASLFMLGLARQKVGDPLAHEAFLNASRATTGSDFFEMFRMSAVLQEDGEQEASETLFQAAQRDYAAQGYDPRLFSMDSQNFLYPVDFRRLNGAGKRVARERLYQIGPETGSLGWDLLANEARSHGQMEQARIWAERAHEARIHTLNVAEEMIYQWVDPGFRWALAALFAAIVYPLALFVKYFQRGRADIVVGRRLEGPGGQFRFLRVEYWSWTERFSFLAIVLIGWLALGIAGGYNRAAQRSFSYNFSIGSFADPEFAKYISHFPPTPEREMLLRIHELQQRKIPLQASDIPTAEQMRRALLGGGYRRVVLLALAGPMSAAPLLEIRATNQINWLKLLPLYFAVLLPAAMAAFLMPQWEKQSNRSWLEAIREALLPGSAGLWSVAGALVLVTCCHGLVEFAMFKNFHSIEIFGWLHSAGSERRWQYSLGYYGPQPSLALSSWKLLQLPVALSAVNVALAAVGYFKFKRITP